MIVQETDYDPWGLEHFGTKFQATGVKVNKYLYNGGSLMVDDLNLGLYWTPNRFYDPTLGRFQGVDKLADMFTSVSPMIYGFNNPVKFKDPTGLNGESGDCPDGKPCYIELPVHEITSTRMPDYTTLLRELQESSDPLTRVIGNHGLNHGIFSVKDFVGRGRKLHYSDGEVLKYRNSDFMQGIRAMYQYGVTGSMLAIAGSPILIQTIAQSGPLASMVKDLVILPKLSAQARLISGGLETASQLGTGTRLRDLDYFDIATQSVFGFNTVGSVLTGSFLDYTPFTKRPGTFAGISSNLGNSGLVNLGTGAAAGLSTDFISNKVKSPPASFVLFLGTDMIMKFNANQLNKAIHD